MIDDRLIRVHTPKLSTFLVVIRNGFVVDVTLKSERWAIDKPETVVAAFYRSKGATFVNILRERTVVRCGRGYCSRPLLPDTSKRTAELPKPKPKARRKITKSQISSTNIMESLINFDPNKDLGPTPF